MHRIVSVNDLAQLPDDELLRCLHALRSAIGRSRSLHAAAVRSDPKSVERFRFKTFDWQPRAQHRQEAPKSLRPETPIVELPVRLSARLALQDLHIHCVEDLAEISEQELESVAEIGRNTIVRLREMIASIGMNFLPDTQANVIRLFD